MNTLYSKINELSYLNALPPLFTKNINIIQFIKKETSISDDHILNTQFTRKRLSTFTQNSLNVPNCQEIQEILSYWFRHFLFNVTLSLNIVGT